MLKERRRGEGQEIAEEDYGEEYDEEEEDELEREASRVTRSRNSKINIGATDDTTEDFNARGSVLKTPSEVQPGSKSTFISQLH